MLVEKLYLSLVSNSEDVLNIIRSKLNLIKKKQDSDTHKVLKELLDNLSL